MTAHDRKIYLNGDEAESGIKRYFLNEIEKGPSKIEGLSFPLFTTSSGTIVTIITLYRFFQDPNTNHCSRALLFISIIILLYSAIVAITFLFPEPREINSELFYEYNSLIQNSVKKLKRWLITWLFGVLLALISLFI